MGRRARIIAWAVICLSACASWSAGQSPPDPSPRVQPSATPVLGNRKPQWPLKTKRSLLTDEQIARIRQRCVQEKRAAEFKQTILTQAAYWAALPDEQLRALIPDSRVPRATEVSAKGCPVHGTAIYRFGTYPWKLNREDPLKVVCPVGGESYPSNDFRAFYNSGFRDRRLLTGNYADDGRGWQAPDGEKYWFVAYACHWQWSEHWRPALRLLSQAYLLTGERNYARKALVLLDRIAEIYPGMDSNTQSRFAEKLRSTYPGKVQNALFETWLFTDCIFAYDRIFDVLTGPQPMDLPWRRAREVQANIEANLIEEGIDAVHKSQIQGGHGSELAPLLHALIVRQQGPLREALDWVLAGTNPEKYRQGINYALYNLILKDGMAYETSPFYSFNWVTSYVETARVLSYVGIDLYEHPKMNPLFAAPLNLICTERFTPNLGDAGKFDAGWIGPTAEAYGAAYRRYREPRFAWAYHRLGGLERRPQSVEELLDAPLAGDARFVEDVKSHTGRLPSRFMDGCGMAILTNPKDTLAVSAFYGRPAGHGHQDQLGLELFGYGHRLSPDLGYPDSMNAFVSGLYSWSRHTISHNCLSLDRAAQSERRKGTLLRFHNSPSVRVVDLDAAGVYPQAKVYRRTLVQVDIDDDTCYLVDVMRCQGGRDHLLSIHGNEGAFSWSGDPLSPPQTKGTLAGPNVAYGTLFDDPVLGRPGYQGRFDAYRGSGYQHFFNWQKTAVTRWGCGTWLLDEKTRTGLRVHAGPAPGQEVIVADAYVSPTRKIPTVLKYMLVHREAGAAGQTFVSVWEPFRGKPMIDRIEEPVDRSPPAADGIVTLSVHRDRAVDHIVVSTTGNAPFTHRAGLKGDNFVAVATVAADGRVGRAFAAGGTELALPGQAALKVPPTLRGSITRADYANKVIWVQPTTPGASPNLLTQRCVRIFNELHSCAYVIGEAAASADLLRLRLDGSDVYTGRLKLDRFGPSPRTFTTTTSLMAPADLVGMRVLNEGADAACLISAVEKDTITLQASPAVDALKTMAGRDVMIADFGEGDQVEIELSAYAP